MKTLDLVLTLKTLENKRFVATNRQRDYLCRRIRIELAVRANRARTLVNLPSTQA